MKTIIKNLITSTEEVYINKYSPGYNIISSIMLKNNMTSNLHNTRERKRVEEKYSITEKVRTQDGRRVAYCESLDIYATQY